jgi:hypothetical protein
MKIYLGSANGPDVTIRRIGSDGCGDRGWSDVFMGQFGSDVVVVRV